MFDGVIQIPSQDNRQDLRMLCLLHRLEGFWLAHLHVFSFLLSTKLLVESWLQYVGLLQVKGQWLVTFGILHLFTGSFPTQAHLFDDLF